MSKKTRKLTNKAGKLMKCDGKMLKKVIEAKGYKCHELSKMLRYCSDYLTTCCRTNKISDVAAKYLMDYKIFPQMYDLEGEIIVKVDEPKEVKIDKDNKEAADKLNKRMDMINSNSVYGMFKSDKEALAQEAKEILNRRYGKLEKEVEFGTPYGIVRSEKNLRNCIKQAIGPKSQNWGTNLIGVRDMLEKACFNGMPYNLEDMRNDLLAFAANVDKYPEKWVDFVKRMSLQYEPNCKRSPFAPTAQEIKKVLNDKYGRLEKVDDSYKSTKEVLNEKYWKLNKDTKFGYGHVPSNPGYTYAGHEITWGFSHLMHAVMDDVRNSIKTDPEFKELIKQAVKEAYDEL